MFQVAKTRPAPRKQYAYYLLAIINLATIGCALWLNHALLHRFETASESNDRWAAHVERCREAANGALVANAPGNNVFVSGDVAGERERMRAARESFDRVVTSARRALEADIRADDSVDPSMLADLDAATLHMVRLADSAESVFRDFAAGDMTSATRHMAAMDAELFDIQGALAELNRKIRIVQKERLTEQRSQAESLRRFEIALGGLVTAIVLAIVWHGQRLFRRIRHSHEELEQVREQLSAVVAGATHGILLVDEHQIVRFASPSMEPLFGYSPEELTGEKITRLLPHPVRTGHDQLFAGYLAAPQVRPLGAGRDLAGLHRNGAEIPLEISVSPVIVGGRRHILATLVDVSWRRAIELESEQRAKLLKAVTDLQSAVIAGNGAAAQFGSVLNAVLELTGSDYGLIGEVLHNDEGAPYIRTHAIRNVAGDDASRARDAAHAAAGFELWNLQSLVGRVATERAPVIANDPLAESPADFLPAGHPPIRAFLGLPFLRGDEMLGVMCLANRPGGYDLDLVRRLGPVLSTCAGFIAAARSEERRNEAERSLRLSMEDLATAQARSEEYAIELELRNSELEQSKARADAANRAKGEFLANMSHEIRTPMTAILGFTEVLLEPDDSPDSAETRVEAVRTIQRNGEHLLGIINDILDLSKIDAGKLKVESIACSPMAIVADVVSLMQVRSSAKGIAFGAEFETPLPEQIVTDPTRLRQILVNLVGNAIKFTEVGGVRLVARLVRGDRPQLEFDVVDSGIGLSAEQRERLFQPFSQADASTTRKFGGTGLGLAISKRLAELLGGDVCIVESTPGVGTRFRLSIYPGSLAHVRMHMPQGATSADRLAGAGSSVASLAGVKVLLAEDGPDNQRLISLVLRKAGAKVNVVENGQLAVDELLRSQDTDEAYDILLTDMQMPVMDGYHAAALLRAKGYRGPIIALTAHAMSGDREKCLAAGCDDFATKPVDRAALIATLAKYAPQTAAV